jgi:hypothetical protein
LYIFWGAALPVLYFAFLNVTIGGDPVNFPLLVIFLAIAVPFVFFALGIRGGRRWAMSMFRVLTWLGICTVVLSFLIDISLVTGLVPARQEQAIDAEFTLILSVLLAPLGWWLQRKSRTVRWLDPSSRPSEWEPPLNRTRRR